MLAAVCLWVGGTYPSLAQTTGTAVEAPGPTSEDILGKLRTGGYVIYLRHTQTDQSTKDGDLTNMSDCSKQRILSKEGREAATKLGETFKALKLPVATTLTSQFCRAKETAQLMGFDKTTEIADLNNDGGEPGVSKDESERRAVALRKLLAAPATPGKNTLIVGHVPNIRAAAGLDFANMKEGEFTVFAPKQGEPGFEAVGRIAPDAFHKLAQTASK
jgi:broad specificity phosphatase PhoE